MKTRIAAIAVCLSVSLLALAAVGARIALPAYHASEGGYLLIDAGHGGEDGGAVSSLGLRESELNLQIAKRAYALCRFLGIPAKMTRTEDVSVYSDGCRTLSEKKVSDIRNRVKMANAPDCALLLSVHQNHFSEPKYRGAQVFYGNATNSKELAERMQQSLWNIDSANHRRAKRASGVYLLEHAECPAILVECGFLSNPSEAELLTHAAYQKKLAMAILAPIAELGKAVTGENEI